MFTWVQRVQRGLQRGYAASVRGYGDGGRGEGNLMDCRVVRKGVQQDAKFYKRLLV